MKLEIMASLFGLVDNKNQDYYIEANLLCLAEPINAYFETFDSESKFERSVSKNEAYINLGEEEMHWKIDNEEY